jgi:hypothetical protein
MHCSLSRRHYFRHSEPLQNQGVTLRPGQRKWLDSQPSVNCNEESPDHIECKLKLEFKTGLYVIYEKGDLVL